ncbi:MAG: hypothetical protein FJ148_16740 [Deltaproteobacteria bacterium]|nr:hypothetical protein [Deltaproteobacteria bacterium]
MSMSRLACSGRGALVVAGSVLVSILAPLAARAQSGATLTPDRHSYVVNKDVGSERWTINLNLASLSPQRAINVTGNVYRDGQSPSFVWCQERDDSNGSLANPSSSFRLRCSGASACGGTATGCARSQWSVIADLVEIPASFFLPPGGAGTSGAASAAAERPAAKPAPGSAQSLALPAAARPAANEDRGANLPPDGANLLVNKELGGLRWSISLNQIPAQRGNSATASCSGDALECIVTTRFLSVTGNVYPLDGSAPQFVWCQERQDSTGNLNDPNSEFRFGCVGTSACTRTASECAAQDWQAIPGGSDVRLNASFFLPPGGLPAIPQSDPEIVVIGRTSDPPSMVVPLGDGAAAAAPDGTSTVQGLCQEGASCTTSVGGCGSVQGRVVNDATVGCACLVADVPPGCITCGGGATGQCGGGCQYQIGGATARGQCLPFSSTSADCACYAANRNDGVAISICGGSLGSECPSGKCCSDDVRDGCDPSRGDTDCPGICVDSNGCDPTSSQCGSCLDQTGGQTLLCGSLEAPHGASCCEDCPDGSQNCYCEPGRSCNLEADGGGCCPTSRPDICNGSSCIPSGANCCVDCPDGGTDCYCAAGSLCVLESEGGGCCPLELPVACNGRCLEAGRECCSDCPPGVTSCSCPAASLCIPEGQGGGCEACPAEAPVNCRNECLPSGYECYYDQFGGYCEPGFACKLGADACLPAGTSPSAAAAAKSIPRGAADASGAPAAVRPMHSEKQPAP